MNASPTVTAARLYLRVMAEQLGFPEANGGSLEAGTLTLARPALEELLGWQAVVTCAGWAVGAMLTATGLGLVIILDRPEWRCWGPVPGLLAALTTLGLVLAPMVRLPARAAEWRAEAVTHLPPPSRIVPIAPPAPRPAATAPTVRCRARAPSHPGRATPGQIALESRLLPATGGPATERMRFAAHPGRPGHVGATQGIDPAWPYVT